MTPSEMCSSILYMHCVHCHNTKKKSCSNSNRQKHWCAWKRRPTVWHHAPLFLICLERCQPSLAGGEAPLCDVTAVAAAPFFSISIYAMVLKLLMWDIMLPIEQFFILLWETMRHGLHSSLAFFFASKKSSCFHNSIVNIRLERKRNVSKMMSM